MAGRRTRAASARREQGLKKKAAELATLCGVDVCIVGRSPDGELFFWPDDVHEVRRIAERYLDAVGGGGGTKTGRKRKRAEEVVGDVSSGSFPGRQKKQTRESGVFASLGADRAVDEAVGEDKGGGGAIAVAGDNNGGGGAPVLSFPPAVDTWIHPNGDFDLWEALYMMSSPSPVEMPDDLSEPLQMADGSGAFPFLAMVPLPTSAAAAAPSSIFAGMLDSETTTCDPQPLWALEDGFPCYTASLGPLGGYEVEDEVVIGDGNGGGGGGGATAVPPVDPLFPSLAAAYSWTHQKGDFDLVEALYMMSSLSPPVVMPDGPEPLQRADRGASPFLPMFPLPSSAAVGSSSIVAGLDLETTCAAPEPDSFRFL